MTVAAAAKWNVDGSAVGASAQGYAETGCAVVQRSVTTVTPTREMDAAGTAWWRRGSHAAEPGRTGSAEDLATRVWEDAAMARGRQGRRRSATTGTLWAGTDAAHHARSSAGGSARGETQTAQTRALHQDAETRSWEGRRSATTATWRTETGAHHRA